MKTSILLTFSLLAVVPCPSRAAASVLAIDLNPMTQVTDGDHFTPGSFLGFDEQLATDGMLGWIFALAEPAWVTGVGWYDENPEGLSHAHQIGVWQFQAGSTNWNKDLSTNAPLLFSVMIPAGTNATLTGVWRKADLPSPQCLPIGSYVIAGTYYIENPDVVKFVDGSGLPTDPRIIIAIPAAATYPGLPPGNYTPGYPQFRIPNFVIGVPSGGGVELGANLFLIPASPSLQASRSGNQIVLSWPPWATNFVLETSSALGAGACWTTLTNAASVSGSSLVATNAVDAASVFYRLRSP